MTGKKKFKKFKVLTRFISTNTTCSALYTLNIFSLPIFKLIAGATSPSGLTLLFVCFIV